VWQEALDLVPDVYCLVLRFPGTEQFGLSSQLRRAVVSVPANIAEGQGRLYVKEFIRHLSIARGSLAEVDTLVHVTQQVRYVDQDECCDSEEANRVHSQYD
jgi:four helix bundle protein